MVERRTPALACRNVDPKTQRSLAYKRLVAYLKRDVLAYSPYYRQLFHEHRLAAATLASYDAFAASVPFTHKSDLQDRSVDFVLQPRWLDGSGDERTETISAAYVEIYEVRARIQAAEAGDVEPPTTHEERIRREFLRDWQPVLATRTGGSTGISVESSYTYSDLMGPFRRCALFHHNIVTWTPTQRFMSIVPAGEHLGFYGNLLVPILNGQPLRPTYGGKVMSTEDQVGLARRARIQALHGTTSYVASWLDTAGKMRDDGRIDGLPDLQVILVLGEALSEGYRHSIKGSLARLGAPDCELAQGMSSTELKSGGFRECSEGTGLHVDPQHFFIEIIDPDTKLPVAPGTPGVLVWSHVDWHGTAILRYWSGDVVQGGATFDACPNCKLVVPRLHPPLRRLESDYLKIRGTRIDLADLRTVLEKVTGRDAFQFEISLDAAGVGRHRLLAYVREDVGATDERVRQAVMTAFELRIDKVVRCTKDEMNRKLYGDGGWKPRWLIHDSIQA